ncbi:hypothetical protein I6F30_01840 [Bradyrhizobium sp. NBAIM20]|uniref:hypothetical protein n=1 Tax=unclassified Bradyrhizobium TaxID=2631580 RepID=UPI001CD78347|nr:MULTISPECIES: hypothetical protein [unclassified Bradyrhizobium]MCA1409906.1 hypothetical protein [Bradyrhizobium sp. NBAIM20]MCA1459807.1 hypothetical protein [Bradyrhizobium sp. NBAIM18]
MRRNFTLSELDAELNELQAGAYVQISREDYERFVGLNDAALGRLKNFARGHQCVASFADAAVLFRKRIAAEIRRRHPAEPSI